jgi:transposase/G:T-mismatch repair DNA endonuclease (very short patch repair protein)
MLSKADLERMYIENKESTLVIAKKLNVSPTTVYQWLKKNNIPIIRSELLSKANKDKPKSAEHRRKLSLAHKDKKFSEEHRKKLSLARRGKHRKNVPDKDLTYQLYWQQKLSANQIAKMYGVDPSTILFWIRMYGIKVRTNSEAHKGRGGLKGDKNPAKRPEVKAKIAKAIREKWKNPDYRQRIVKFSRERFKGEKNPMYGKPVPEKRKKLISQKVKEFFKRNPEVIDIIKKARRNQKLPSHHTKPELKFIKICEKYSLPFKYVGDGSFWIGGINPDFIHSGGERIAVEIFGDYWHSPDKVPFYRTEHGRRAILNRFGWKLITLWEHELKSRDCEKIILKKLEVMQNPRTLCMASYQT